MTLLTRRSAGAGINCHSNNSDKVDSDLPQDQVFEPALARGAMSGQFQEQLEPQMSRQFQQAHPLFDRCRRAKPILELKLHSSILMYTMAYESSSRP